MVNVELGKRKRKFKACLEKLPTKKKKLNSGQEAKIKPDLFVLEASNGNVDDVKGLYNQAKNKYALDYLGAQLAAKNYSCQNILDCFSQDEDIKKVILEQADFKLALESKNTSKLKELIEKQPQLLDSKINGTYPLFVALNKGHVPSARLILKSLKKTSVLNYIERHKNGQGLNAIEDANKNKLEKYARILINALPDAHRTRYIGEGWVKRVKHTFQTHNDKVSEARESKSNLVLNILQPIYSSLPSFAFGPVAGVTALGLNFSSMLASYGASELVAASHKYLPANVSRIVQPTIHDAVLQLQAYSYSQNPISYLGGLAGAHIATEIASSFTDNPEIIGAAHFGGAHLGQDLAIKALEMNHSVEALTTSNSNVNHSEGLLKLSDFTQDYSLKKGEGIMLGGFYFDKLGQKWLIKNPHETPTIFNEYTGGALFAKMLPQYTPSDTIMIMNQDANLISKGYAPIMIGSKVINGFQSLRSINGVRNDLDGILEIFFTSAFLGEGDLNLGNLGVAENRFVKVDHGFTFYEFKQNNFLQHYTLLDYIDSLIEERIGMKLHNFGFDRVYQALSKIADSSLDELTKIVKSKSDIFQLYIYNAKITCKNGCEPDKIIQALKLNHKGFNDLKKYMSFEKAALNHDASSINKIMESEINLKVPFTPFFDRSEKMTPAQFINKVYPEYTHSKLLQ